MSAINVPTNSLAMNEERYKYYTCQLRTGSFNFPVLEGIYRNYEWFKPNDSPIGNPDCLHLVKGGGLALQSRLVMFLNVHDDRNGGCWFRRCFGFTSSTLAVGSHI